MRRQSVHRAAAGLIVLAGLAGAIVYTLTWPVETPQRSTGEYVLLPEEAVEIPIDLSSGGPVVEVLINGRGPYRFLLDTASSETHISPELARELGLPATGSRGTFRNAAGQQIEFSGVLIESIRLGEAAFLRREVMSRTFDSERLNTMLEDGIIGWSLFDGCVLTVDFPAKQLLIRKGSLPPVDAENVLASVKHRSLPTIEIAFGDRKVDMVIDTGALGVSFLLPADIAHQLTPIGQPMLVWAQVAGDDGVAAFSKSRMVESARMGKHIVIEPIIASGPDSPAVVGMNVLRHFSVTFDVANERIALHREVTEPVRIGGVRTIGMTFGVRHGAATIDGIDPLGPAGNVDAQVGDRVLKLCGREFADLDNRAVRDLLDAHETIDLVLLRDGKEFTISVPIMEMP